MMSCLNKMDTFESNLAYLLISGIINLEKSKQLGFNSDYIRNLLEQYKKQVENPYVEYYYNEKTGTYRRLSNQFYLYTFLLGTLDLSIAILVDLRVNLQLKSFLTFNYNL